MPSQTGWKPEGAAGRSAQSLDPVRGSEASRTRPAVALSNDAANETATATENSAANA